MKTETRLIINGTTHDIRIDASVSLLDAIRDVCGLYGTKKGCDHGLCGACTVIINGERRVSCLTLAASHDQDEIKTIEGVASLDGALHPLQKAFINHDAFQCGYCTPGQIMSILGGIEEGSLSKVSEIPHSVHNMCRCGCYDNIKKATAEYLVARKEGRS